MYKKKSIKGEKKKIQKKKNTIKKKKVWYKQLINKQKNLKVLTNKLKLKKVCLVNTKPHLIQKSNTSKK